jgi:hypothetical protein
MVSMAEESAVSVGRGADGVVMPGMTQAGMVTKRVNATKKVRLLFMGSSLEKWNQKASRLL